MRIIDALVTPGLGGYYFDDLAAIKNGVKKDGMFLLGKPVTKWHDRVRQPGETMSIILILEDGKVAVGDCAAIQYSGVVGRDPILLSRMYKPIVEKYVLPFLIGQELTSFHKIAEQINNLTDSQGDKLHTGIRYGASLAVLDAVAQASGRIVAEVVRDEYSTTPRTTFIDVLAQSGDERYEMADKMIMKRVPAIPQGLFNHISKVGRDGSVLLAYVDWLRNRVQQFGDPDYNPTFHLDVYGTVGDIFDNRVDTVADYLEKLAQHAHPYPVRVEHPIDLNDKEAIIDRMSSLVSEIERRGIPVEVCADDWCNTLDDIKDFVDAHAAHMIQIKAPDLGSIHNAIQAVIYCKENGVKAFLGGTCNETDISSRLTVQVAIATGADQIYNKPGMAVDEGYMIVFNEIQRTLALLKHRT
jgi:methylaspartate ammonia-lyase